ncbi:hypothetical protein HY463_01080 [Candidatus Peregrinibacteria bacterium]|nr:hypothetical protein [Candidatus Peregrinibacteria bacterium]
MQKHAHSDQTSRNRLVVLLILVILALATVTVMYLRAVQQIDDLTGGEGKFLKGVQQKELQVQPSNVMGGEI